MKSINSFDHIQEELQHELGKIDSGKSKLIDLEELDRKLEKIISANANKN